MGKIIQASCSSVGVIKSLGMIYHHCIDEVFTTMNHGDICTNMRIVAMYSMHISEVSLLSVTAEQDKQSSNVVC